MKSPYIAVAVKAARRAASEITRAATSLDTLEVENKSVNDFVTAADRAAEAAIVDCLRHAYPDHAILTEEAGRIGAAKSDYLWIVDPIDGTLNFMHGIPQYAVSIALAYRGEVVAGVIYDVAKNELFTAAKGRRLPRQPPHPRIRPQGHEPRRHRHGLPVPPLGRLQGLHDELHARCRTHRRHPPSGLRRA